jgi:hypothetical protein
MVDFPAFGNPMIPQAKPKANPSDSGLCNRFGGIILKRDRRSKRRIWEETINHAKAHSTEIDIASRRG